MGLVRIRAWATFSQEVGDVVAQAHVGHELEKLVTDFRTRAGHVGDFGLL